MIRSLLNRIGGPIRRAQGSHHRPPLEVMPTVIGVIACDARQGVSPGCIFAAPPSAVAYPSDGGGGWMTHRLCSGNAFFERG
jgi:hypothetical protein